MSCSALHVQYADQSPPLSFLQTNSNISSTADASFYFSLDPLGPHLDPGRPQYDSIILPPTALGRGDEEDPRRLPSQQCLGNPAVQAGAARLQTTMTTTMGLLSALSTGWWGHYGERNGRTKVLAGATLGLFLTYVARITSSFTPSPVFQRSYIYLGIYTRFNLRFTWTQTSFPRTSNRRPSGWLVNVAICHFRVLE